MSTREFCLAKADEAEALARVVSLATDKARLMRQAAEWRRRALQARPANPKT